jgi:hypothetical protein
MDRDLGKPNKSKPNTGMFAGLARGSAGLPMKQIHRLEEVGSACFDTCPAHGSSVGFLISRDGDGTFSKEIYR